MHFSFENTDTIKIIRLPKNDDFVINQFKHKLTQSTFKILSYHNTFQSHKIKF